ncbi:MAG: folate-binding protein YgfZ [Hyphomonas sp.]|nr:folate-binding protein YgfZ [Hyphomonas sp.]
MDRFPNRALIRLAGPDTIALLERTVTHSVTDWREGELRYGALLTPQGKVIADYIAQRTEDGVLVDVHEDATEDLMKRLKLFRLRAAVEIARDDTLAAVTAKEGDDDPRSPKLWWRWYVPAAEAGDTILPERWRANRISAGVPEWGSDYRAGEVFPTDINMDVMGGIDYKKGCFVGQEVASRMKRRGKIRKRTIRVYGGALIVGSPIIGGTEIGTVTSIDPTDGQGLALVRLDRLQKAIVLSLPLTCNEATVTVDLPDWAEAEMAALAAEGADE